MTLEKLLQERNIDTKNIKIIRHTLNRKGMKKIIESRELELYQSYQKNDVFKGYDYIVSFSGLTGSQSILYGCYKVNGVNMSLDLPEIVSSSKSSENWGSGPYFKYDLEEDNALEDLEGKLIIDWGKSPRSWHQKRLDKKIIEILP